MKTLCGCRCLLGSILALFSCYTVAAATYTLTINTNGSGTVSRNPTNSVYPQGAVVTLTAMPSTGWIFTSWSGDASGTANPLNVTMDTNKTITANFSLLPTYTLTVSVSGQGSVDPPGGTYESNTVVSLTAAPANGWLFNAWSGDANGNANPLSVTMNTDKAITAVFVQPPVIVSQPQSAAVGVGDTVTFNVGAEGTAPLSYLWQFIGSPITGATTASLTITNVQPSDAGDYSVVVSNSYGSTTSQAATLTVTNACFGSNVLTVCDEAHLREAIALGGTVRFCCNGTITLTNTIDITNDVALDASDRAVVLSGNNAVRLFSVRTNITFALTNLSLANGRHVGTNGADAGSSSEQPAQSGEDGTGGAIYNDGGTVRLVSCVLSNNSTLGGNAGVYNESAAGGAGRGGAVFNRGGTIYFESVFAVSNSVAGGFGSISGPPSGGTNGPSLGGVLCSIGGSIFIADSVFLENYAKGRYSTTYSAAACGGTLEIESALLIIAHSAFISNRAVGESTPLFLPIHPPSSAYGGALYVHSGTAILDRSQFVANNATGGNGSRGSGTGEAQGGAINNFGVLYVSDSSISKNQAVAGNGSFVNATGKGGGLYNAGTAYINGTTFDGNLARGGTACGCGNPCAPWPGGDAQGGAIFNAGFFSSTNCTLALNQVEGGGTYSCDSNVLGGTASGGAVHNAGGTLNMMNVTVASNAVIGGRHPYIPDRQSGPSLGANIANTNGTLSLRNSLVAYGVGSSNAWGMITDDGFNMSSDGSCNLNSGASFNFTDPKLGPLADNGGPTLTMALQADSPAIDFGSAIGAPATDQRGFRRPFGDGVDIGAFEVGPPTPMLSARHNGSMLELSFTADAGVSYELLRSTDLHSWEMQEIIGAAATNGPVSRFVPMTEPQRFFRLRAE